MITGSAAMAKVLASGLVCARPEQEFGALGRHSRAGWRRRSTAPGCRRGPTACRCTSTAIPACSAKAAPTTRRRIALRFGRQQPGNAEDHGNAEQCRTDWFMNAGPPRPYQTMPWVAPAAASSSKLIASSGVSPTSNCSRRASDRKPDAETCVHERRSSAVPEAGDVEQGERLGVIAERVPASTPRTIRRACRCRPAARRRRRHSSVIFALRSCMVVTSCSSVRPVCATSWSTSARGMTP